jgi:dihydrodipicolinate reductase
MTTHRQVKLKKSQATAVSCPDVNGPLYVLAQVKQQHPNLIMVDYTVPDVIHDMVDLYIKHQTPFVMGTTGGNRAQILADVKAADLYAVIAPQMGKQVRLGQYCRLI